MGSYTLAQMENDVLSTLQQTALVNFAGAPNWAAATNPEFDQATVDYRLNEGYLKVVRDVSDIDVAMYEASFLSTAQTYSYPLPPAVASGNPNPPMAEMRRLFYSPQGFPFTLEHEPGIRMLPWKEFQRYTASGYLQPASFGPYPEVCSITPDRKHLYFYPGSANAGDTIQIQYSCVPTPGTLAPLLVNESDTMIVPDDFAELVVIYALYKLWPKARALTAAEAFLAQYQKQLDYIRAMWKRRHGADQQRFTDVNLDRQTSGPWGWS